MIDTMIALGGGVLTAATWLSVLRTVFPQGKAPSHVARLSLRAMAAVLTPIGSRLAPARGERLLALCGPLALLTTLVVWIAGGTTGFVLFAIAAGAIRPTTADIGRLLAFGLDGPANLYAVAAAASCAVLVALFVVYLVRLTAAYGHREALVARLSVQAAVPSDAERIIAAHVGPDGRDHLNSWFGEWTEWLTELGRTHVSYPAVAYFRATGTPSWLAAAVITLDAAALLEAIAPDWAPSNTRVLLGTGGCCLQRIAASLGIAVPPSVVSLHGREQCGFADTLQLTRFAGLPVTRTERVAWEVFQRQRTRYAPYAAAIAARLQYGLDTGQTTSVPVVVAEESGGR